MDGVGVGGGEKTVCYSAVMRGGFTAVGLFGFGSGSTFVNGAGGSGGGEGGSGEGGGGFEMELYVAPQATAFTPSWAPVSGGTLHAVVGANLRPAHDHGGGGMQAELV